MTTKLQIFKCPHCGNIVEMVHEGGGQLVMLRPTDGIGNREFGGCFEGKTCSGN